eukprot:Selendium_serpulae@DN5382_c0_g1_i3.p1
MELDVTNEADVDEASKCEQCERRIYQAIILQCPHIICLVCAAERIRPPSRNLRCPKCHEQTKVSERTLSILTNHPDLQNHGSLLAKAPQDFDLQLADMHRVLVNPDDNIQEQPRNAVDEICGQCLDETVAFFCATCHEYFCFECYEVRHSGSRFSKHEPIHVNTDSR